MERFSSDFGQYMSLNRTALLLFRFRTQIFIRKTELFCPVFGHCPNTKLSEVKRPRTELVQISTFHCIKNEDFSIEVSYFNMQKKIK